MNIFGLLLMLRGLMNIFGGLLMLIGIVCLGLLALSIPGWLPAAIESRLPAGYWLYGFGIGLIVGGSITRQFDSIIRAALREARAAIRKETAK